MTGLAGKVVWITGASSGIGEALAHRAQTRGAKVVLSARRVAELERVRAALPRPEFAAVVPLDLGLPSAIDDGVEAAQAAFGPIDVLVNNAGISQRTQVLETPLESYRQLFEVDLMAPIALTKALLPGMLARGGGHVVTISSVFGHIAMARRSGYAAAKHALHGFFDCARIELGERGMAFTVVCPGFVRTGISVNALGPDGKPWGKVDHDIGQGMDPLVCAEKVWRAVERNRYEVVIAGKERIAVWLKRFLPLRWYTAFARRLRVS